MQKARRIKIEHDLHKEHGELLPADLVILLCAELHKAASTKIQAITSKIRSRMPDLAHEVTDEIDNLIREALEELGTDGIPEPLRKRMAGYLRIKKQGHT